MFIDKIIINSTKDITKISKQYSKYQQTTLFLIVSKLESDNYDYKGYQ